MAFDAFIKFEKGSNGLKADGESTDDKHKGEIEIQSFSWGASNPTTINSATGGAGGGKVTPTSFNFMTKTDKASPMLFLACCTGAHFETVTVYLRKAGGTALEYLQYTFNIVFVESIQWSGSSGGDDTPSESVSLAFGVCKISYQPQKSDGSKDGAAVESGYDFTKNKKI